MMVRSLLFLLSFHLALSLPQTEPPLLWNLPFISIWNALTDKCSPPLDMAPFQNVSSPSHPGQFLTLFYEGKLGQYPKYDHTQIQQERYGGLPQNGNLTAHLTKAEIDIDKYIPQDSSPGLAVIDWESWRPLWDQNWSSKKLYQDVSIKQTSKKEPGSFRKTINDVKKEFETAARRYMEETLKLGRKMRPNRRWGFYLFPDCFNYDWMKDTDYTGKCSKKTQVQNNQMSWLWEASTALFPSIYLNKKLRDSKRVVMFVQNRVQEALRVATLPNQKHSLPVYVYARPLYRDHNNVFLSQSDLVHTVGESAALGAAGIVMWGSSVDFDDTVSCDSLSSYLSSTLGPYIANVTAATILCSQVLCQGKGRCVRKNFESAHYLHLSPAHFRVLRCSSKYVAVGLPSRDELTEWEDHFTCQCYYSQRCGPKLVPPKTIQEIWV
ncbi:hyaluronidase-2-like isoform X2 [Boleophthalmus pectinirostris]|nr:hyaluronidase-2-like isoform X2 [Boleophthalmus pectinirostris]XP_055011246.1 hyaluronidase-2-like isoform X2 [Boleophthalmus pectinirostris]